MSVSYYAHAVVGVRVERSKFYKPPYIARAFSHSYDERIRFDPQTGKPLWMQVTKDPVMPGFDMGNAKIGDYDIVYDDRDSAVVIALVNLEAKERDAVKFMAWPCDDDWLQKRHVFQKFLEPLGLWDEAAFGIYSVLYCSY